LKAAKAGKAVYAEKPFGGSVADIEEVLSACKASNVQFMDGTMWVHSNRTLEIEKSLQAKEIGNVQRVVAAFTFHGPDEKDSEGREWLHGGNGRTDKTREPMGCFGDQGWYTISAILLAYNFELPVKVMMAHTKLNKVDTIIGGVGVIWFAGDRMATLDFGADSTHRSQVEIVGETGSIKIDDLVGGQGRTGDFMAYFQPFVGSSSFVKADVMGKDETVDVEPCDHVIRLVSDFVRCVVNEKVDDRWPARTIACHKVMCALFESAQKGGTVVEL
jgi:predicted dehydrogenase